MKFYPDEKREGGISLSHAEGGHKTFWGSFYAIACSFSHIEGGGGAQQISTGGTHKVLPHLEGGGAKSFGPAIFPFCSPPPSAPPRN